MGLFGNKRSKPSGDLHPSLAGYDLPCFPALVLRALEKIRDEEAPLSEIATLVSADPGLSTRLLQIVNSSAYCLVHKVQNIDHAIALLGRGEVESVLIAMAARQVLPRRNAAGFDASRFWRTAARRAAAARSLANLIDPSRGSESFTAALLQDMAVPVLVDSRGYQYGSVLEGWHTGEDDIAHMERQAFGWDHTQVAQRMCEEWAFPQVIAQAIGVHHAPWNSETGLLPAVHLVSVLREVNDERGISTLIELGEADHGLSPKQTQDLLAAGFEAAEEIAQLFE